MLTRRDSWETYGSLRFFAVILNSVASQEMRSVALQRILSWIIHAMQNHFMPPDCELNFSAIPRKYFVSETFYTSSRASFVLLQKRLSGSWSLIANLKFKKIRDTLKLVKKYVPRGETRPFLLLNYDVACKCCFAKYALTCSYFMSLLHHIGYHESSELIVNVSWRQARNFLHMLSAVVSRSVT